MLIAGGLLLPRYLRRESGAIARQAEPSGKPGGARRIASRAGAKLRRGPLAKRRGGRAKRGVEGKRGVSGAST